MTVRPAITTIIKDKLGNIVDILDIQKIEMISKDISMVFTTVKGNTKGINLMTKGKDTEGQLQKLQDFSSALSMTVTNPMGLRGLSTSI